MESEKLKKKLKYLIENIETELVKIEHEFPKAEVLTGIAADTNGNVETFSKHSALEDENTTDEDLNKHRKCELNTVFLEGGKECEDSFSNGLTSDGMSSFPSQTNSSSSSVASQSSLEILELDGSVDEKFEFVDSKDESNLNLKGPKPFLYTTDSKMNFLYTVDENKSVTKHFKSGENAVRNQDSSLLIKEEIRDLRKTLGKCFSYLGKLETIALKRDKLPLKKGNKFPKSDKNDVKTSGKKGKNSDFTLPSSNNFKDNINTYNDNKKIYQQGGLVHFNDYRNDCTESSNLEHRSYDRFNGKSLDLNPLAIEWGLATYVIKEDGNYSIQIPKSDTTENHPLNNRAVSFRTADIAVKDWNEEYCSKNNKKSTLSAVKVTNNEPFKNCVTSVAKLNIGEKKNLWKFQDSKVHNSIAAKNQPSRKALPKKLDMVEGEKNNMSYLTRSSGKLGEIKKKRTVITTQKRQAKDIIIVSLLVVIMYLFLAAIIYLFLIEPLFNLFRIIINFGCKLCMIVTKVSKL